MEQIGAAVNSMHETDGFDLLVIFRGEIYIMEVKDPDKFAKKLPPSQAAYNMLTSAQKKMKHLPFEGKAFHSPFFWKVS